MEESRGWEAPDLPPGVAHPAFQPGSVSRPGKRRRWDAERTDAKSELGDLQSKDGIYGGSYAGGAPGREDYSPGSAAQPLPPPPNGVSRFVPLNLPPPPELPGPPPGPGRPAGSSPGDALSDGEIPDAGPAEAGLASWGGPPPLNGYRGAWPVPPPLLDEEREPLGPIAPQQMVPVPPPLHRPERPAERPAAAAAVPHINGNGNRAPGAC